MEWEKDAVNVLAQVPRLVRGRVKKKVEEYARDSGQEVITKDLILKLKNGFSRGSGKITTEGFEEMERLMEGLDAKKSRFINVRMCGGAAGCPLTLIEDRQVAEKVVEIIESSGLSQFLEGSMNGPALSHNRFRVSIAGCPNCCSEPQIKDFGIIAEAMPGVSEEECINCMKCVKTCRENAVVIDNRIPALDLDRCINCGECVAACPTGTLIYEKTGLKVVVGGKLGRHPQLASTLLSLGEETSVFRALSACIEVFKNECSDGERFGVALNRIGIDVLSRKLKEVENG